jgi:hypothetical protein
MAKNGDVHTAPDGDGWAKKVQGNKQVLNTATTKAEAQAKGRAIAESSWVRTPDPQHGQDGRTAQQLRTTRSAARAGGNFGTRRNRRARNGAQTRSAPG